MYTPIHHSHHDCSFSFVLRPRRNPECEQPLCAAHSFKDIFTSYQYCAVCADAQTYSSKLTQSRLHDVFCKIQ